ncbi:hypothetical protein DACRYDRAFT_25153 [Dacryopinax primogenitus]|uniref:Uncharacterized protein n=1 Tax=Dacryopinax primogenitus (strain DJM 731) TaxID=1858805 RepID=M5FNG2_DACPD|nr:uncharacterized protein DACRYDRAFT_25153 [Dacryopinax primogenitus]EJT97390.1 hypothetical protein DACRYDRAFT_25153 [Dacryopinax primogenitus]
MVPSLKRKSTDDEVERPNKTAKVDLSASVLFSVLPQCLQMEETMDVDMDAEAMTPVSADSSPVTHHAPVLPSYPHLQIYTPLKSFESSPPIDIPLVQSPFFESVPVTPSDQVYPEKSVQLLRPLISPTSSCSCERIPKLQLSCKKPNGNRSLWSYCDSCGAVGIVA